MIILDAFWWMVGNVVVLLLGFALGYWVGRLQVRSGVAE